MKKWMLLGALTMFATLLIGADKIFEINEKGEIFLPKSLMYSFQNIGFECRGGYVCKGTSGIWLEAAQPFSSMTVAVTAGIKELPKKDAVLFLRPGFHNTLVITPQGKVAASFWVETAKGKYENVKLFTRRTVRPGSGSYFRAALSVTQNNSGSVARLYLDGALEAEKTFSAPLFGYKRMFHVGGAPTIPGICGFNGVLRSFQLFNGALSDDEIASLR